MLSGLRNAIVVAHKVFTALPIDPWSTLSANMNRTEWNCNYYRAFPTLDMMWWMNWEILPLCCLPFTFTGLLHIVSFENVFYGWEFSTRITMLLYLESVCIGSITTGNKMWKNSGGSGKVSHFNQPALINWFVLLKFNEMSRTGCSLWWR